MFEEVYSKIEDYCNYRIGTGYSGFSAKKGIKKFLDYEEYSQVMTGSGLGSRWPS